MELTLCLKKNLSKYLERKGMTMVHLSEKSGVARKTLYGWTSGNSPRSIEDVYKVSKVLGVSIEELSFGDNTPVDDLKPLRLQISAMIRMWRERMRLTPLEAAHALKISIGEIQLYETGEDDVPVTLLARMATVYQVPPEVVTSKLLLLLKR